jgi:hypothetical protein
MTQTHNPLDKGIRLPTKNLIFCYTISPPVTRENAQFVRCNRLRCNEKIKNRDGFRI